MKIIFWNIKFLGSNKFDRATNATAQANALGNTYGEYIMKVVTGDAVWAGATSQVPADIFVIVELKGGGAKGNLGTGACLRVLNDLVPAMNVAVPANDYAYVQPRAVGTAETIGVVYDQNTLTYVRSRVMRDTDGNYLNKRSPFLAEFTVNATGDPLNVVGIHGPTSQPGIDYRQAIEYANKLDTIDHINQAAINPKQDLYVGGDFNCCPNDSYWLSPNTRKRRRVSPFEGLLNRFGYSITLATPTDTSLLDNLNGANYLSQPYDNIVFQVPSQGMNPPVERIDLVGNAPTWGAHPGATFNVARKCSDHLPLSVEY